MVSSNNVTSRLPGRVITKRCPALLILMRLDIVDDPDLSVDGLFLAGGEPNRRSVVTTSPCLSIPGAVRSPDPLDQFCIA